MKTLIRSLQMDWEFLLIPKISFLSKLSFVAKKYAVFFKNLIFGFKLGKSKTNVFGKTYYYDDKYGNAFLQSVYIDNYFLKNYIKDNSVIVDIGANVGQFNFFCANYLNAKKIFSFEPASTTYSVLKKNASKNSTLYKVAVGTEKKVTLYIPETTVWASTIKDDSIKENIKTEKVQGVVLDKVSELKKLKNIDMLKIDTEGNEFNVINTGQKTILKSRYILVESSVNRKSTKSATDIILLLRKIIPDIELVDVGRAYRDDKGKIGAMDLLFHNPKGN